MADTEVSAPFEAYKGPEPFAFVSYAHSDAARVFPQLSYLNEEGYRLWYDEGIDPGNEWPDEIARALVASSHFVVFVSNRAVQSRNVRNEINFALNKQKPFLAVFLEDTDLPPGLELRMGDIQAIKAKQAGDSSWQAKVVRALPSLLKALPEIDGDAAEVGGVDELVAALAEICGEPRACKFGLATIWKAAHADLLISSWNVGWERLPPTLERRFRANCPPRCAPFSPDWLIAEFNATTKTGRTAVDDEIDGAMQFFVGYATCVARCNNILLEGRSSNLVPVALPAPRFSPPWHDHLQVGTGDLEFKCKQCGYDGFRLGPYDKKRDVPRECPGCGLGRDMPLDAIRY